MIPGACLPDQAAAAAALARGAVVLLPTDTIPGFHARVDDPRALAQLAALKGREADKPFIVLAASREQAASVVAPLDARTEAFVARCWPGPFSLVLPARAGVSAALTAGSGRVAVRVPDLAWLRELAHAAGGPLASTSANFAGEPPATTFAEAVARFGALVAAFGGPDPESATGAGAASALVDLSAWPPRVLREGPRPLPEPPAGA